MKFRCAPRLPRVVACVLLLLAAPASLFAQIIFTVHATANTAALGYTLSQPVTFTFVLDNFSPATPVGGTGTGYYLWTEEFLTDPELWTSAGGTGLSGAWSRPNATNAAPFSKLYAFNNSLQLIAACDAGVTGLTVNGVAMRSLELNATYTGLDFSAITGGSLPDPTAFFSTVPGTYIATSTSLSAINDSLSNIVTFTVTSLTISSIPEPSVCAVAAALGAFGFVAWRRRACV